jgi:hypothetical protein
MFWTVTLRLRNGNGAIERSFQVEATGPRAASGEARSQAQADGYRVVRMISVMALCVAKPETSEIGD